MTSPQIDIEIYIKSVSLEAIHIWLESCTYSLEVKSSSPKQKAYWATFSSSDNEFEIIALNKVQSNFSSIWFNTNSAPWADDKACAQTAFEYFQCPVRCVAAGWQEGDAPDQWLNIDAQGKSLIDWL